MASRVRRLFITLDEFADLLRLSQESLKGTIFLPSSPFLPYRIWDGTTADLGEAVQLFFSGIANQDVSQFQSREMHPPKWGWIHSGIPEFEDGFLTLVQMDAKSDWWDSQTQTAFDNPASVDLFDDFWKLWKKHFKRPIGFGYAGGPPDETISTIGYTEGVIEFARNGGRMRQMGVKNTEFFVPGIYHQQQDKNDSPDK